MQSNYRQLIENVKNRINPDQLAVKQSFSAEISGISYSDVLVYIRYTMKGVETAYTAQSKEAGENVKTHLKDITDTEFKFQGSVMTNTHIKGYSDIDLLVLSTKFYSWDAADSNRYLTEQNFRAMLNYWTITKLEREKSLSSYQENPLNDLKKIRVDCEDILSRKYRICDITQPKCIKIENQDLKRKVDIVVANWYDDVRSIINDKGENRGIQIYNKQLNWRETPDYPFISIKKINERGTYTNGRLKKMIRFIKNIKADSNQSIDLSSFDINAICYDVDTAKYQNKTFVELVPVIYNQLKSICTNTHHSDNLVSVDEREYIFRGNQTKIENIRKVLSEVEQVYLDLKKIHQHA